MSNYTVRVVIDDKEKKGTGVTSETSKKNTEVKEDTQVKLGTTMKVATTALGLGSLVNGIVGEFTEKRFRQKRMESGLKLGGITLALASANPVAIAVMAVGGVSSVINYQIKNDKQNVKASYLRQISGDTVNSGSRWRGAR